MGAVIVDQRFISPSALIVEVVGVVSANRGVVLVLAGSSKHQGVCLWHEPPVPTQEGKGKGTIK